MRFIFYDFETTGRNYNWDQIIQVGAVLTNETLILISTILPKNISELSDIKGIGKNKLALYGEEIISIIKQGNHL